MFRNYESFDIIFGKNEVFMFFINLIASQCRKSAHPVVQPAPQKSDLEKRIYPLVLKLICNEFLGHGDRANLSASCPSLRGFVQTLPAQQELSKILPLVLGRCRMIQIQNSEPALKRGDSLPFNAFDYDPREQCVLTGDHGDYENVNVRLWNRRGEMLRQFAGHGGDSHEFYKSINSVCLDMERNRAMASSSSSDGNVRVWDLRTGQLLFRQEPLAQNLDRCAANFASNTLLCGSWSGYVRFVHLWRPDAPDRSPVLPEFHSGRLYSGVSWMCDAPEIDRLFSMGTGLKIWDRTKKTCLSTHDDVGGHDQKKYYDRVTQQLYVGTERSYIRVIDAVTGKTLKEFQDEKSDVELRALHFDTVKKWLFASFTYTVDKLDVKGEVISWGRTKLVVWDTESGKMVRSFITLAKDGLCHVPTQIDFNPSSETILTAGNGVQLWDLSGKLMSDFLPGGHDVRVRWDKENRLLVVLKPYFSHIPETGTVTLVDYAPLQQPPAKELKESKKS